MTFYKRYSYILTYPRASDENNEHLLVWKVLSDVTTKLATASYENKNTKDNVLQRFYNDLLLCPWVSSVTEKLNAF